MNTKPFVRFVLAFVLIAVAPAPETKADGPVDVAKVKKRQELIDQQIQVSLETYKLFTSANSRTAMKPLSVLRWVNDPRLLQQGEATLVLWTEGGRPEALASIYPWNKSLAHELVSLSRAGGVLAKDQDHVIWAPKSPGITFNEIPDAPAPADSTTVRLAQMKSLAERFKARMTGWKADDSDRADLRLLPKPIYRYDLKNATASSTTELEDGAAFAFVLGTDPEAVLLIEAVRKDNRPRWQYALARSTYAGVEVRLGSALVWTAAKIPTQHNPALNMFGFSRRLPE